jgi:hypothetical protein
MCIKTFGEHTVSFFKAEDLKTNIDIFTIVRSSSSIEREREFERWR